MNIDIKIMYIMRGVLAIACGLTILALSSPTTGSLAIVFISYCWLEGLITLLTGLKKTEKKDPRWYLIGESVVNLGFVLLALLFASIFGFLFPRTSSYVLLLLLSGRIILIGLIELLAGIIRKKAAAWLRVPIGLVSVIFGLIMIYLQDKRVVFFVLPLGLLGIIAGIFLILICFKLGNAGKIAIAPEA